MITRDFEVFREAFAACDLNFGPATPRGVFLVTPGGFMRAEESAQDNVYMASADAFDGERALAQHRDLVREMASVVPAIAFPGCSETPDAVFPNNVFATGSGRVVVGRMLHPVRQREATRADMRAYFKDVLGYKEVDLSGQPHPCELTGAIVIDRARGVGFIGLSDRANEEGARLMHEAFALRTSFVFDLAAGEYHTNVVLAILAGRAAIICPKGFASREAADFIASLYAPHVVMCSDSEHQAFVGNCISASGDTVWMSAAAERALHSEHAEVLRGAGFAVRSVELDAIEAGGGSLRCCIGEIY